MHCKHTVKTHTHTQFLRNALSMVAFSTICFFLFTLLCVFFLFQQKNETQFALEQTYDIVADGFNDTYMSTIRPTVSFTFIILRFILDLNLFVFSGLFLSLFHLRKTFKCVRVRNRAFSATIWFASTRCCYVAAHKIWISLLA